MKEKEIRNHLRATETAKNDSTRMFQAIKHMQCHLSFWKQIQEV